MIALDEDALICDMAETYHIYDMYSMPVEYIAILANGLRADARIRMIANGMKVELNTLILAHIADNTAINVYAKTKDAQSGRNRPKSLVQTLCCTEVSEYRHFEDGASFMEEWSRLNGNRTR